MCNTMHVEFLCLLIVSVIVITFAKEKVTQKDELNPSRFLFYSDHLSYTTFTVLKATTTTTTILTRTTTCTTSTSTLSSCTTGRRRRGLFFNENENNARHRRARLFYDNDEFENKDGSVFLPFSLKSLNAEELQPKQEDQSSVIPLVIESGYELPEASPANRFLVSFGTKTITSFSISISTVSLTAICSSTTGFPLCGGNVHPDGSIVSGVSHCSCSTIMECALAPGLFEKDDVRELLSQKEPLIFFTSQIRYIKIQYFKDV